MARTFRPTPTGRFRVAQLGIYLQDQWTPNSRLTVTAGVRMDLPLLQGRPKENPLLLGELQVSSAALPAETPIWSPRLGVNYDVTGRGRGFVRGGIGLFSGRPAYRWLQNAYGEAGSVGFVFVRCEEDRLPEFTLDPSSPPERCADAEPPRPTMSVFDPEFRFPRDLKISAGADVALPWGMVGTADVLFTAGIDQVAVRDLNLGAPVGVAAGEGGRVLYGTFDADGESLPNHRSDAFDAVTQVTNGSGNRAYTLALQLRKRLGDGGEVLASYSYTDARDRTDIPALSGRGLLALSVLDGTWEDPALRPALWSLPHKMTLAATASLPLGLRLGVTWLGISGAPVTYVVAGDANADGFDNIGDGRYNDAVYVPSSAQDITLAPGERFEDLDRFIRTERCLRAQRGRLMRRNSCRNPWTTRLDARLSETLPSVGGQSLELVADFLNVLNLLDGNWGRVRGAVEEFGVPSIGNRVGLLELVGYDAARGRGVYHVLGPRPREVLVEETRWRVRLGLRYGF